MSPLRYRCATGPYVYGVLFIQLSLPLPALALARKLRFLRSLSSPRKILNLPRRQSATGPYVYGVLFIQLSMPLPALFESDNGSARKTCLHCASATQYRFSRLHLATLLLGLPYRSARARSLSSPRKILNLPRRQSATGLR